MSSRRKSRETAVQALFQIEMNTDPPEKSLAIFCRNFPVEEGAEPFFLRLVQGVCEHKEELDRVIRNHSENWRLERMSRVDRNILRMAAYELIYCPDIPPKVVINEAVDLGNFFGSDESGAFVNGILDSIFIEKNKPVTM